MLAMSVFFWSGSSIQVGKLHPGRGSFLFLVLLLLMGPRLHVFNQHAGVGERGSLALGLPLKHNLKMAR
eukprot:1158853-Pelagomonas_calceolata.AAC.1